MEGVEEEGGVLAVHHDFWDDPNKLDLEHTITEMLNIPPEVAMAITCWNCSYHI